MEELYIPKHERRKWQIWRVLGPAGPEETVRIEGTYAEAEKQIQGCWDWTIKDEATGKEIL